MQSFSIIAFLYLLIFPADKPIELKEVEKAKKEIKNKK